MKKRTSYNMELFISGDDLPLLSGQPQRATLSLFSPKQDPTQLTFFNCKHCKDSQILTVKHKRYPCPYCSQEKTK